MRSTGARRRFLYWPPRGGRGPGVRRAAAAASIARAVLRTLSSRARSSTRTASTSLPEAVEGHAQHLGQEDRESYDAAHLVTRRSEAADPAFFWSRDSRLILFVQEQGRRTRTSTSTPSLRARPRQRAGRAPARNVTDAKGARAFIYAVPKRDPDTIYVGLNDATPLARRLQGEAVHRRAHARPQEQRPHRGLELRPPRQPSPRRARRRTTATPRCCASYPNSLTSVLDAPCSRAAASAASTPTANASTWRRTRARPLTRLVLSIPRPPRKTCRVDPLTASTSQRDVLAGDGTSSSRPATRTNARASTSATGVEADYRLLQQKLPQRLAIGSWTSDDQLVFIPPPRTPIRDRATCSTAHQEADAEYKVRERLRASTWRR